MINRRDFLKLGGIAGLAALMPWKGVDNWIADATAAWPTYTKKIWNARLNTGQPSPSLYATYGWIPTPQLNRVTVGGWADGLLEPDATWHQNFAANVVARHLPVKAIQFDHEDWPVSTQAERIATATKFANFARNFKSNLPDYQIGFYAYPLSNSIAVGLYPGAGAFNTFRNANIDSAEVYTVVDFICPSMYWPYTRKVDPTYPKDYQVKNYFLVHLMEARRMANLYGSNQPIYPYVWERKGSGTGLGTVLDFDTMEQMYRLCYQYSDGLTIWGGFFDETGAQVQRTWAQDTAVNTAVGAWWNNIIGPMASSGQWWGPPWSE